MLSQTVWHIKINSAIISHMKYNKIELTEVENRMRSGERKIRKFLMEAHIASMRKEECIYLSSTAY